VYMCELCVKVFVSVYVKVCVSVWYLCVCEFV
jgi:hypothetical protein